MPRRNNNRSVRKKTMPALASTCQSKKRYSSETAAEAAIIESTYSFHTPELATYRCPVCLGWHLTKLPRQAP